jgi:hypothetical protein
VTQTGGLKQQYQPQAPVPSARNKEGRSCNIPPHPEEEQQTAGGADNKGTSTCSNGGKEQEDESGTKEGESVARKCTQCLGEFKENTMIIYDQQISCNQSKET